LAAARKLKLTVGLEDVGGVATPYLQRIEFPNSETARRFGSQLKVDIFVDVEEEAVFAVPYFDFSNRGRITPITHQCNVFLGPVPSPEAWAWDRVMIDGLFPGSGKLIQVTGPKFELLADWIVAQPNFEGDETEESEDADLADDSDTVDDEDGDLSEEPVEEDYVDEEVPFDTDAEEEYEDDAEEEYDEEAEEE